MKSFFSNDNFPRNIGLIFGFLAALTYYLLSTEAFSHGPSSVGSSIGLFLTIITTPFVFLVGYLIGASLGFLIFVGLKRRKITSVKGILSSILIIGFLVLAIPPFYHYIHVSSIINKIEKMNGAQLAQAVEQYKNESSEEKPFIYSAIVTSPNADPHIFHQVVLLQDPSLSQNMWSITGLLGKNKRGYPVLRLIALNHKTKAQTLALLANEKNNYILDSVAGNPNTPIETLYAIHKSDPNVYHSFLWNPKTPADILINISNSLPDYLYNDYTYQKLMQHPNLSSQQRENLRKPSIK